MSVSKIRKRYVAFEVVSRNNFTFQELRSVMLEEAEKEGLNISVLREKYDENTKRGLIRANHTEVLYLRKILDNIQKISDKEVKIKSIGTSGTIRTANIKYLQKAFTKEEEVQ